MGFDFEVIDCKIYSGYVIHIGKIISGNLKENIQCILQPDYKVRKLIANNHSATHILNHCLNNINGNINQKGSKVTNDYLRFDFNFDDDIDINKLENNVNEYINKNITTETNIIQFKDVSSDIVFDENDEYPKQVRVVKIGNSKELCSGTHCINTKDIGEFIIMNFNNISKEIKRIIAVTGDKHKEIRKLENDMKNKIKNAKDINDILLLKNLLKELEISLIKKTEYDKELEILYENKKKINKDESSNIIFDIFNKYNTDENENIILDLTDYKIDKKIIDKIIDICKNKIVIILYLAENYK